MAASNCAGRARGPSRGLCSAQRERVPFRTASFGSYVASLNIPTTHAGASVGLLQGAAAHCTAPAPRLAPRRAVALAEAPPAVSSVIEDVRAAHKEIRDRVVQAHTKGGVLYVASGAQILRNGSDVFHKFRADSNFAYLTGVAEPDCGCLIDSETGAPPRAVPRVERCAATKTISTSEHYSIFNSAVFVCSLGLLWHHSQRVAACRMCMHARHTVGCWIRRRVLQPADSNAGLSRNADPRFPLSSAGCCVIKVRKMPCLQYQGAYRPSFMLLSVAEQPAANSRVQTLFWPRAGRYTLVVPKLPPDAAFWVGALPGEPRANHNGHEQFRTALLVSCSRAYTPVLTRCMGDAL